VVATALRDSELWLTSLSADKVGDERLLLLMERVELVANPQLTPESSVVEISVGGATLSKRVDAAKGTRGNPLTLGDLKAKFDRCAAGRLALAEAGELFDLLAGVDEVKNLGRIFELLRSAKSRNF
jgi:2-methylcitrate dehydratase PrpD